MRRAELRPYLLPIALDAIGFRPVGIIFRGVIRRDIGRIYTMIGDVLEKVRRIYKSDVFGGLGRQSFRAAWSRKIYRIRPSRSNVCSFLASRTLSQCELFFLPITEVCQICSSAGSSI